MSHPRTNIRRRARSVAWSLGLAAFALVAISCSDDNSTPAAPVTFTVTVRNVSTPNTIMTDRAMGTVPLSPGAWAVYSGSNNPAFAVGDKADGGTELIAEDGFPSAMLGGGTKAEMLANIRDVTASGTFATTPGTPNAPAIFAGQEATFTFQARPGQRLTFETMFVQSNDWFYGLNGVALFQGPDGAPVSGDITNQLGLYDAGTEADTPPGTGPDQKPAQDPMVKDQGPKEDVAIALATNRHPGYTIPANSSVIQVIITPQN